MPVFIGYTRAELKGTMVTWYGKGNTIAMGTAAYNDFRETQTGGKDTLSLGYSSGSLNFTDKYDVEVYIPSFQRNYYIADVENEGRATQVSTRCGNTKESFLCINDVVSCMVNGQQQYFVETKTMDRSIYLIK